MLERKVAAREQDAEFRDTQALQGAGSDRVSSKYWDKIVRYPQRLAPAQWRVLFTTYQKEQTLLARYGEDPTRIQRNELRAQRQDLLAEVRQNELFQASQPGNTERFQEEFDAVMDESGSVSQVILNCSLGIILTPARRHATNHMTMDDKFQEGILAVSEAIEQYDPTSPVDFYRFASRAVRSKIFDARIAQEDEIRIPRDIHFVYIDANNFTNEYLEDHGEMPTRRAVIEHLTSGGKKPTDLQVTTAIGMVFKEIGVVPVDVVGEYVTEAMTANTDFNGILDSFSTELTEREREVLFGRFDDAIAPQYVAERNLGVDPMTERRAYRNVVDKLSRDPQVLAYWEARGGEPPQRIDEPGEEGNEKRTEFNAQTLEYRYFASNYSRFLDPRTAANEYNAARTEINRLNARERTWFVRAIINKVGREGDERRQHVSLQILKGINMEGLDENIIMDRYLWSVEKQTAGSDPVMMLRAGVVLAEAVHTDERGIIDIQNAWAGAFGNNWSESEAWQQASKRMPAFFSVLRQIQSLKDGGNIEAIRDMKRSAAIEMPLLEVSSPQVHIIETILGNTNIHKFFDVDPEEWTSIRAEAQIKIRELPEEQRTDLVRRLIFGIARDDAIWDVDRRDSAVELLGTIDLRTVAIESVREAYHSAVKAQLKDADPMGSTESLVRVGKLLVPYLPGGPTEKHDMQTAWNYVGRAMQGKIEWDRLRPEVDALIASTPYERAADLAWIDSIPNPSHRDMVERYVNGEPIEDIARSHWRGSVAPHAVIDYHRRRGLPIEKRGHILPPPPSITREQQMAIDGYLAAKARFAEEQAASEKPLKRSPKWLIDARTAVVGALYQNHSSPQIAEIVGDELHFVTNTVKRQLIDQDPSYRKLQIGETSDTGVVETPDVTAAAEETQSHDTVDEADVIIGFRSGEPEVTDLQFDIDEEDTLQEPPDIQERRGYQGPDEMN